jgi:hypothetical protein
MKNLLTIFAAIVIIVLLSAPAFGDTEGDYRSVVSGNWSDIATWERYTSGFWIAAVAAPISTDGLVTIRSTHTVTLTGAASSSNCTVSTGGILDAAGFTLSVSGTFTLASGATFKRGGSVKTVPGTTRTFDPGKHIYF